MESHARIVLDRPPLKRSDLLDDPMDQFRVWMEEARVSSGLELPEAACLSTVSASGDPDGRMVLVRGIESEGVVFYTNFESRKARSLAERPTAALTLYWEPLRRQVRIRGRVERVSEEQADAYFAGRPRGSRIGAWASAQSEPVESREALDARYRELEAEFGSEDEIPRPPHWGGFRVLPTEAEFWQEGKSRLHDRLVYRRNDSGWSIIRLQP